MCRHVAYVGPPTVLSTLLYDTPRSLLVQGRHSLHQSSGPENPDGFGVGWWERSITDEPARYRTATPIWLDQSFPSIARVVTTDAFVAAVRLASPGLPVEESGNAPFRAGRWLFSLNGYVRGFGEGDGSVERELRAQISPERLAGIEGASDSEALFALTLDRLDGGTAPGDALADVVALVERGTGGRLNLLLSDGERIAATAAGNSLFECAAAERIVVASEPLDGDPAWTEVPDRTLVTADRGGVTHHDLGPRPRPSGP
jgi:glutamine amidotransferase